MRFLAAAVLLLAALLPRPADAMPCVADPMTTGERALSAIFHAVDELGRRAYDAAMPGEVVTFRRVDGRWRAILPRALAQRAQAKGCDLEDRLSDAAAFYGDSVDFTRVRVLVGDPVMEKSFVFHQRVKIGGDADECPARRTLVHEFGHVWQYQHGQWQATMGLIDQIRHLRQDVYELDAQRVIDAAREGRTIDWFIREKQAELFEHAWHLRVHGDVPFDPEYAAAVRKLTGPALAQRPTWPYVR